LEHVLRVQRVQRVDLDPSLIHIDNNPLVPLPTWFTSVSHTRSPIIIASHVHGGDKGLPKAWLSPCTFPTLSKSIIGILTNSGLGTTPSLELCICHRFWLDDLEGFGHNYQLRIAHRRRSQVRPFSPNTPLHLKTSFFLTVSGSMEPAFYRGDLLFLTNPVSERYKTGDITVYKIPGADIPIVHRVLETHDVPPKTRKARKAGEPNSQLMLTKGDNNYVDDLELYQGLQWLERKHIVGKVRG
jgi:signal peptidase I